MTLMAGPAYRLRVPNLAKCRYVSGIMAKWGLALVGPSVYERTGRWLVFREHR